MPTCPPRPTLAAAEQGLAFLPSCAKAMRLIREPYRMTELAAVVVAAGRGLRAGGDVPKQSRRMGGETVLRRTLAMLAEPPNLSLGQPLIRAEDRRLLDAAASPLQIL